MDCALSRRLLARSLHRRGIQLMAAEDAVETAECEDSTRMW